MNSTLPDSFYFLRSICFVTGLTVDLADQPGRRRASSQIYSSKPRNLDILTDSGIKAVGRLSPTPTTEVETRDGCQETGEYCTVISLVTVSDFRATVLLALGIYHSLGPTKWRFASLSVKTDERQMKCEVSAACDSETDPLLPMKSGSYVICLMSAVAGGHICLCVTCQIGFDLMSLNSIEVPAVLPCPAYVFDPLVRVPKDVLSWRLEV